MIVDPVVVVLEPLPRFMWIRILRRAAAPPPLPITPTPVLDDGAGDGWRYCLAGVVDSRDGLCGAEVATILGGGGDCGAGCGGC